MSSELDIQNYFEHAKDLTLKAGEVSQVAIILPYFGEIFIDNTECNAINSITDILFEIEIFKKYRPTDGAITFL